MQLSGAPFCCCLLAMACETLRVTRPSTHIALDETLQSNKKIECGSMTLDLAKEWVFENEENVLPLWEGLPFLQSDASTDIDRKKEVDEKLEEACANGADTSDDNPKFAYEIAFLLCTLTKNKPVSYAPPLLKHDTLDPLYEALLEMANTLTTCVVVRSPPPPLDDYRLVTHPSNNNVLNNLAEACLTYCVMDNSTHKPLNEIIENAGDHGKQYLFGHLVFGMILGYSKEATFNYFRKSEEDDEFTNLYKGACSATISYLSDHVLDWTPFLRLLDECS